MAAIVYRVPFRVAISLVSPRKQIAIVIKKGMFFDQNTSLRFTPLQAKLTVFL